MNLFKLIVFVSSIFTVFSQVLGDITLDDFEVFYADNAEQCYLGEAYGYSITKEWGSVDTGGGWWSPYADELGTKITNGDQVELNETNCSTIVDNGSMHILFKTHLSSADFSTAWPYAGIYCDLMKDTLDYFDFSNLGGISMRLKGSGNIRVLFHTKDVYEMVDSTGVKVGWGYYGFNITLDSTYADWKSQIIPAPLLDPEVYSPAYDSSWTWDHGKSAVKGFAIEALPDEDTATNDSVELWIDDIVFTGLDYQTTFGFVHDTNVPIRNDQSKRIKNDVNLVASWNRNSIRISYNLNQDSDVYCALFDVRGKRVSELVNAWQSKGRKDVSAAYSNQEIPSGVYFLIFKYKSGVVTEKLNIVK